MKKVTIIALHLAFGGVEKAITGMANIFADKYEVEILCVYDMPGAPVYKLDERVKVTYLMKDIPNREQWKKTVQNRDLLGFIRESLRSVSILAGKKLAVIKAIRSVKEGVIITTRHEDNLCLSRWGRQGVYKIAQIHHDHRFEKKYIRGFKYGYGNIDVLAMLTPGLVEEVQEMMRGHNAYTKVIYMPNFLENYPQRLEFKNRNKVVVTAGRLHPVKGFDRLIRSFAAAHEKKPDWQLRIVGEGAEREHLEKLIGEYGANDYITLCGEKNAEGVQQEMLDAAIYAMTSFSEGFAFVLIEAQSCGLPIVAYDVRVGPKLLVRNGANGFLVPDGDVEGYTRQLIELMDNETLREAMAKTASEDVREFFRDNVAKLWFEVIGE